MMTFKPLCHSWVALHPEPKGIVQFIGGAFFGSFPTIAYRYLLEQIFEAGYSVIALPFRFSFRHWSLAIELLKEQETLRPELIALAKHLNYDHTVYEDKTNYSWIGHSLGCKYIALLELLSDRQLTGMDAKQIREIEQAIARFSIYSVSIKGQPSLLLAPDISDTESAIPIRALAQLLDKLKLGVLPTRAQTQDLIEQSQLFNLTGLISFDRDTIAGSVTQPSAKNDVLWFLTQLKQRRYSLLHQELSGKHLEPVGIRLGRWIVDFNPLDKFAELISDRPLETVVIQFLDRLQQRQQNIVQTAPTESEEYAIVSTLDRRY
ncbi:DUF1350 family protein [Leptolyngbya sp. NIES-2104]|uniref:DUF1350 family protein n=1 Tax=Leptolyngbya sp. NIES-2104 TaxID=1552121 RepID=UPI00073F9767|nr:DUF1350 family protein [Leptolyngbya sp. NIES-2104]